jgi:hypothetical protein
MAFEVGDRVADLTFCGNEYLEAYFDPNGISDRDFKDRRKDLYHNRLGREIGMQARQLGLSGSKGEQYLIQKILEEMKTGERFIHHYKDPRVQTIGTEEQLGCSGLPAKNLVDTLLNRTQKDKPSDE